MATFLDLGLLQSFSAVFTWLLVFVLIFGILSFTKLFGEGAGLHAIIAFSIASLTMFSPTLIKLVGNMAPWFVVIFLFILFLLLGYKMFGITDTDITDTVKKTGAIKWTVFIVGLIIFIASLSNAYGPGLLPTTVPQPSAETAVTETGEVAPSTATSDFGTNVAAVFFHPKVIGMLFI